MPPELSRMLINLEGLSLSRTREMRPMLARILTDLFVQAPGLNSKADIERYGTLIESLHDDLDLATRALIAEKLARRNDAPAGLVQRLATDAPPVAAPLLSQSPALGEEALLDLLGRVPPVQRVAIARRNGIGERVASRLAEDESRDVIAAFLANETVRLPEAAARRLAERFANDRELACLLLQRGEISGVALAPLFLMADTAGRERILAAWTEPTPGAEIDRQGGSWLASAVSSDVGAALVEHAKAGRYAEIAAMLADLLAVPSELASRVLADPGGEPLLVALKALRLSEEAILSLLILANPEVGRSVKRVFALDALAERLAANACDSLVALWRGSGERSRARHLPQTEAGRPVRRESFVSVPQRDAERRQHAATSPEKQRTS
jgi:uncharacterized protein (DUF2336 family)